MSQILYRGAGVLVVFLSICTQALTQKSVLPLSAPGTHESDLGWGLVVPGFVIHGLRPTNNSAKAMPRKFDQTGVGVLTPGLGLELKSDMGVLVNAVVMRDCYDHMAASFQIGRHAQIFKDMRLGWSFGLYARETPLLCERSSDGGQICQPMDQLPIGTTTWFGGRMVDLVPMPLVHYSQTLYRDMDIQIQFRFSSNFLFNEFGLLIPF